MSSKHTPLENDIALLPTMIHITLGLWFYLITISSQIYFEFPISQGFLKDLLSFYREIKQYFKMETREYITIQWI